MDMRGTGESDKPPSEYTIDMHADDLKSIIEDLQDKKIIFVSSFIGAKIGVKYVTSHPGRISKLVLLSFNPSPISSRPNFTQNKFEEAYKKALKFPSRCITSFWETTIPDPRFESMREWGLKSAKKTPPAIFVNGLFNNWREDVRPLLNKIDIPTLILSGGKKGDAFEKVKKLKEKIPGSEVFIFRGMGPCFINMFAANKFNKILEQFINTGEIKD